jgi:Fe-S-cluster containining protein
MTSSGFAVADPLLADASPCARRTEGCCKEYLVTVTGLDVYRMTRGLGLAPGQFTVALPVQPPETKGFRLGADDDRFQLALDKQRHGDHAGWCVFWMPLGSPSGRCGIYAHRPQVCRTYPATLVDGEVARRDDVLCPAGAWGPGSTLASDAWRRRTERQYAELEIDAVVNTCWNGSDVPAETGEALHVYLTWMLEVYERLDHDDSSPLEWAEPDRRVLDAVLRVLDSVPPPGTTVVRS